MPDLVSWLSTAAAILIAAGACGLIFSQRERLQKFATTEPAAQVVADWRFTGKIDFVQKELGFVLMAEEYRVLESTSGTKPVEVRWTSATLEEAKQVASRNNARAYFVEQDVPGSLRRASLVPELTSERDHTYSDSTVPASNLHH